MCFVQIKVYQIPKRIIRNTVDMHIFDSCRPQYCQSISDRRSFAKRFCHTKQTDCQIASPGKPVAFDPVNHKVMSTKMQSINAPLPDCIKFLISTGKMLFQFKRGINSLHKNICIFGMFQRYITECQRNCTA